jgi:tetratricopeptide (TPR) repeat protein
LIAWSGLSACGQEPAFLAVVRTDQPLVDARGKQLEKLGRGQLLTVLFTEEKRCLVQTTAGTKGWAPRKDVVRLVDAREIFDGLIKANPKEAAWYASRALVWEQKGENEKAIADLDRAIELGHEDAHLYVNRGMFRAAAGQYEQAISDYDFALKKGVDDVLIYSNRAAAYLAKGDVERAIKDCDAVIRREPKRASAYYQRGVAWRMQEDLDKALRDFTQALDLNPDHLPARVSRGFVYYLQNKPKQAIEDFGEVIRRNPNDAMTYNNRGYNRQLIGAYGEALADYAEAIRLVPEYALAYQNRAWLLATCPDEKIRNGRQALKDATRACELRDWKEPTDWKALAAAHAESGDFAKAVTWQKKVVDATEGEEQQEAREVLAVYESQQPYRFETER